MRAQLRCFITEDLFSPDWSTDYHKTISLSLDKSEAKQSFIIILNMEVEEGSQVLIELSLHYNYIGHLKFDPVVTLS